MPTGLEISFRLPRTSRESDAPISFVITPVSFTDSQVACGAERRGSLRGRTGRRRDRPGVALAVGR